MISPETARRQLFVVLSCLFCTLVSLPTHAGAAPAPSTATVTVNGTDLHYRVAGDGAPVVFLHAFLLNSRLWHDQLNGLQGECRCFAVDLRGFGQSAPYAETYLDPYVYADDIAAFIEAQNFEEPVHLVGMSVGGFIAGLVYEKLPKKIASITMISGFFDWTTDPTYSRYQNEMARLVVVEGKSALFRRFDEYIDGPATPLHARARYKSMLEETRTEMIVAFLGNGGTTQPRPDLYDKIDVPVLIPVGTEDVVLSRERAKQEKKKFKNARVVEIDNAGRLLPLENADALNDALKTFWRDTARD